MLRIVLTLVFKREFRSAGLLSCRVLSLAAIILPLMLLLGLKYGVISAIRQQLLSNPATLAVIPHYTQHITDSMVDELRIRPEVGYVLPVISALYSQVSVRPVSAEANTADAQHIVIEMVPTSEGDPVLCASAQQTPRDGEVILSAQAAESLGVAAGSKVALTLNRNSGRQTDVTECLVVGVLPLQHEPRRVIYVPHAYTVKAQLFSVFGETAPHSPAKISEPVYHALLVNATDSTQPETLESMLRQRLERDSSIRVVRATAERHPGLPTGALLYERPDRCFTPLELMNLRGTLQGLPVKSTPWVYPQQVMLQNNNMLQTPLLLKCADSATIDLSLCKAPPLLRINSPELQPDTHATLIGGRDDASFSIVCVLEHDETVPAGEARCDAPLAAVVYRAASFGSQWDYRTGALYDSSVKFRSVRLYSDSLENTEKLQQHLEHAGVHCTAAVNRIRQVLALEQALDKLFIIIAGGAGLGALVSFSLSLFNAAELHRRDYALTRLMGMGRAALSLMPMADALLSTLLAFGLSALAFFASAELMGVMMSALSFSESSLCVLEWWHFAAFFFICCMVAVFASLGAAIKVLRITPAEIIRES